MYVLVISGVVSKDFLHDSYCFMCFLDNSSNKIQDEIVVFSRSNREEKRVGQ